MSGEPVEAAEDTSGVKVGVRVGEEVADVRVGSEAAGEANIHGEIEAVVRVGVADADAGGEADKWPGVAEGTEDTTGQT